jgi:hypothetical protein
LTSVTFWQCLPELIQVSSQQPTSIEAFFYHWREAFEKVSLNDIQGCWTGGDEDLQSGPANSSLSMEPSEKSRFLSMSEQWKCDCLLYPLILGMFWQVANNTFLDLMSWRLPFERRSFEPASE